MQYIAYQKMLDFFAIYMLDFLYEPSVKKVISRTIPIDNQYNEYEKNPLNSYRKCQIRLKLCWNSKFR